MSILIMKICIKWINDLKLAGLGENYATYGQAY